MYNNMSYLYGWFTSTDGMYLSYLNVHQCQVNVTLGNDCMLFNQNVKKKRRERKEKHTKRKDEECRRKGRRRKKKERKRLGTFQWRF
jgi:hypothetical protein